MKVVIIGGVAGGASAAARLRRLDEKAEITIIERTGYVSYANCGLPYYVSGVIKERSELMLQTPSGFRTRFNIDVRVKQEAVSIDTEDKTVTIRRLRDDSEYTLQYDILILAPGAKPLVPRMPGIESDRIHTVRTVEDVLLMKDIVAASHTRKAVIAGGGYIGLEMAENLVEAGVETIIVQRPDQLLKPLDRDMASILHDHVRRKGVILELGKEVVGYETEADGIVTKLKDGRKIKSDIVVMALGIEPETALAKAAGIKTGIKGSIVVNEHMETSIEGIYAVGDAVQVKNFVTGADDLIPLAGPANRQGRIAADNICGIKSTYKGSQGSSIVKVFDTTAATTGVNEKAAEAAGMEYDKVYIYSPSNATYYPGARYMTLKVLFSPSDGRIIGAQVIGSKGVDKRIDVLATAIRAGMTSDDLEELDLAYAPPFSSAKDPVNIAGYVIGNVRRGLFKHFFCEDVDSLPLCESAVLLDVRSSEEFREGHIPGAINIPVDNLRGRLEELDKSKDIYVYCHSGNRSYVACRILAQYGYSCFNLEGGIRLYRFVNSEDE